MNELMTCFATIHRLQGQVERVERQIERGPQTLKLADNEIRKHQERLAASREQAKRIKVEVTGKELSLKSSEAEVDKYGLQLNKATSNKEYQALLLEREAARKDAERLEEEILDAMDRMEGVEAECSKLDEQIRREQQQKEMLAGDWADQQKELTGQMESLRRELAEAEGALPGDARPEYTRVSSGRGADALARAADGVCQGCYSKLTQQSINELLLGRAAVPCKSCGRLLYMEA